MHPQPRVRNKKAHERSHHRFTESIRPSLRNGFNGYFVLSPVTGLFCHRRRRNCFRQLDASVGASGPHDFAVRTSALSSAAPTASTASRLNVRDDRETPLLLRRRAAESSPDLGGTAIAPGCG